MISLFVPLRRYADSRRIEHRRRRLDLADRIGRNSDWAGRHSRLSQVPRGHQPVRLNIVRDQIDQTESQNLALVHLSRRVNRRLARVVRRHQNLPKIADCPIQSLGMRLHVEDLLAISPIDHDPVVSNILKWSNTDLEIFRVRKNLEKKTVRHNHIARRSVCRSVF